MQQKAPKGKAGGLACQVPGCKEEVPAEKAYYKKCRICPFHMNLSVFCMDGRNMRFCKLCRKFEDVRLFEGERRSCRESLGKHNARRRKRRHDGPAGPNQDGACSDDQSSHPRLAPTTMDTAGTESVGTMAPQHQLSLPSQASTRAAQLNAGSSLSQLPRWQLAEAAAVVAEAAVADAAAAAALASSLAGADGAHGGWLTGRSQAMLPPQPLPHPPPPQWFQLLAAAAGTPGLAPPAGELGALQPLPSAPTLPSNHNSALAGPCPEAHGASGTSGTQGGRSGPAEEKEEEEECGELKPASGLDLSAHLGSLRLGELSVLMASAGARDAPEWKALLEEMSGLLDHMPGVRDKLLISGTLPHGQELGTNQSEEQDTGGQQQQWGTSAPAGLLGAAYEQGVLPQVPPLQQAHPNATVDLRRPLAWATAASLHHAQEAEAQRARASQAATLPVTAAEPATATATGSNGTGSDIGNAGAINARKQPRAARRSDPRSTSPPSLDAISEGREGGTRANRAGVEGADVGQDTEAVAAAAAGNSVRDRMETCELVWPGSEEAELLQAVELSMQLGSLRLGDLSLLVNSLGARELSELLPGLLSEMSIPPPEPAEGAGEGSRAVAQQQQQHQQQAAQRQQLPSPAAIAAAARLLGMGQESSAMLPQQARAAAAQLHSLHPALSPQEQLQLLLLRAHQQPHQQQPPPPPGAVSHWSGFWPPGQAAARDSLASGSSSEVPAQPGQSLPPRGVEGSGANELPRTSSGPRQQQQQPLASHQSPFAPQASSFQQSPFLSAFTAVQPGGASQPQPQQQEQPQQQRQRLLGCVGPPPVTSYAPAPGVRSISFQRSRSVVPYQSVNFEHASSGVPPSPLDLQALNMQLLQAAGYGAQQSGS